MRSGKMLRSRARWFARGRHGRGLWSARCLVFHLVALVSGGLAVPPSSVVERSVADLFTPYYGVADLGYAYRFYAEPPPTPVVTATLSFGEPARRRWFGCRGGTWRARACGISVSLRWRTHCSVTCSRPVQRTGDGSRSVLARAFARHLCLTTPGCQGVTIHLQHHLIPGMEQVRRAIDAPGAGRFDLFNESLFSTPERIGDYPCGGF